MDFSLITELGFRPTEVFILAMLWQNIKGTNKLLNKLVAKVRDLERKVETTI